MPNGYLSTRVPLYVHVAAACGYDATELVVGDTMEILSLSTFLVVDVLEGQVHTRVTLYVTAVLVRLHKETVDLVHKFVIGQG